MVVPKTTPAHNGQTFSLRAVKIDDNAESRAGATTSLECITYGYTDEHHHENG